MLAPHRVWLLARLAAVPDLTRRGLVMKLQERGVVAIYGSVWRILYAAGMSFKKRRSPSSRTVPTSREGARDESLPGPALIRRNGMDMWRD